MNLHVIRAALAACWVGAVVAAVTGHIITAFTLTLASLFLLAESQRDPR